MNYYYGFSYLIINEGKILEGGYQLAESDEKVSVDGMKDFIRGKTFDDFYQCIILNVQVLSKEDFEILATE